MDFEHIGKLISKDPQMTGMILNMDPVNASEEILGKTFEKAMAEDFWLGLSTFSAINELKRSISKANGDTYYGISFDEFHELVSKYGFIVGYMNVYEPEVNPNNWQSSKWCDTEREVIYYHKSGLVIYLNSFQFNGINTITLMGDFRIKSDSEKLPYGWDYDYLRDEDRNPTGIIHAHLDGRCNMLYQLNQMLGVCDVCETFATNKYIHLWFLTYSDDDFSDRCDNHNEVSLNKVRRGTAGLKEIFKNYL